MNPADLHRNDSLPALDSSPPMSAKQLPALSTQKLRATNTVPRVDVEPIYTQLKAAIGEHWGVYKAALSSFMLGMLLPNHNRDYFTMTITIILLRESL